MSLFTERVGDMAARLAVRTGAAMSRAWRSESVAPKAAGTAATGTSTLAAARSVGAS